MPLNPALLYVSGKDLLGRDRTGDFALTASGSARVATVGGRTGLRLEEATTNLLTNPSAETGATAGSLALGTGTTRVQDAAWAAAGTKCFLVTTLGGAALQGLALSSAGALNHTGTARPYAPRVRLKGSGTIRIEVQILYTDATSVFSTPLTVVLDGTDQDIVAPVAFANPAKTVNMVYLLIRTATAQAVSWRVDAAQIEDNKAYSTSYTDGSLGTGYGWTGVAYASASTRTAGQVSFSNVGRARPRKGAVLMRFLRDVDTGAAATLVALGTSGTGDFLNAYVDANDTLRGYTKQGASPVRGLNTASTAPVGSWLRAYVDWDADAVRSKLGDGAMVSTPRVDTVTAGSFGTSSAGIGQNGGGSQLNGLVAEILIFDRPLTAAELAYFEGLASWSFDVLEPPPVSGPLFVGGAWSATVRAYRAGRDNEPIEELTPWLDGGYVDWDATREIKGAGSVTFRRGKLLSLGDCLRLDLEMEREDGERRSGQLGLYVPTMPRADHDVAWSTATYALTDLTVLLQESVFRSTYNVAGGTTRVAALQTLLADVGISRYALPTSSATLPSGKSWPKGTTRLEAVTAHLKALGSGGIGADMTGRLRAERRRLIRSTEPFAVFDQHSVFAAIREEPDTSRLGNVVVVRGDHPGGDPIVVVGVNEDPDSPASTVAMGRERPLPEVRDSDITTLAEANERAEEELERGGSWERVVRLKILADPGVGINRSMDLIYDNGDSDLSGRYWVRNWRIPLSGDIRMDLTGNRVVRYRSAAERDAA